MSIPPTFYILGGSWNRLCSGAAASLPPATPECTVQKASVASWEVLKSDVRGLPSQVFPFLGQVPKCLGLGVFVCKEEEEACLTWSSRSAMRSRTCVKHTDGRRSVPSVPSAPSFSGRSPVCSL